MSRPIKFRGWNKQSHIMVDNIQVFSPKDTFNLNDAFDEDMIVLPLQYTGLLDRNGKEVYEGDIVDVSLKLKPWRRGTVMFKFNRWGIDTNNPKDIHVLGMMELPSSERIEVIGNVYENTDLLEGEGQNAKV